MRQIPLRSSSSSTVLNLYNNLFRFMTVAGILGIDNTWFCNTPIPDNAETVSDVLNTGCYFIAEGRFTDKSNGILLVFAQGKCVFQTFLTYYGGIQTRMKWYDTWYDWNSVYE